MASPPNEDEDFDDEEEDDEIEDETETSRPCAVASQVMYRKKVGCRGCYFYYAPWTGGTGRPRPVALI